MKNNVFPFNPIAEFFDYQGEKIPCKNGQYNLSNGNVLDVKIRRIEKPPIHVTILAQKD